MAPPVCAASATVTVCFLWSPYLINTVLQKNLEFKSVENGLISYQISNHANNDTWKNVFVIYNARTQSELYKLKGNWKVAVLGDHFDFEGLVIVDTSITIPALSMALLFQE